jgi:hypothetical protein
VAKQRHHVEGAGRRWKVRREDRPAKRDEHAVSFRTQKEADEHAQRLNEYWERGMGERK